MAEITLSSNSIVKPYRSHKGSPIIRHFQGSTFAAGSSIVLGDVVSSDTTAASNYFRAVKMTAHVPSTAIFGVAAANDKQDGSTGLSGLGSPSISKIPVWVADADTEFIGFTKDQGSSACQSTLIGTARCIARDSTLGIWYVDTSNSTAGDVRILITDVPSPGDTNGAVVFKFLSTALALGNI
jgi:hypothetical protein